MYRFPLHPSHPREKIGAKKGIEDPNYLHQENTLVWIQLSQARCLASTAVATVLARVGGDPSHEGSDNPFPHVFTATARTRCRPMPSTAGCLRQRHRCPWPGTAVCQDTKLPRERSEASGETALKLLMWWRREASLPWPRPLDSMSPAHAVTSRQLRLLFLPPACPLQIF